MDSPDRTPASGAPLRRRHFLGIAGGALAAHWARGAWETPPPAGEAPLPSDPLDLTDLPNFCGHEHWGSIGSFGGFADGFRADAEAGALPLRRTTLFDLLLDPYFGGWLAQAGTSVDALARAAGEEGFESLGRKDPARAYEVLRPALAPHILGGGFQCLRQGIQALHGTDILEARGPEIARLDEAIGKSYAAPFQWYRKAMEMARFSRLIRPVHPEFHMPPKDPAAAAEELAFTETVLRIDPLLGLWPERSPRRDALAAFLGVDPRDAKGWREFLGRLFDRIAERKVTGIKQLQAYSRDLDFAPRKDGEVAWSGDRTAGGIRAWQDWIVQECCAQAHERGWAHQVHVGTHNLPHSSPLPLEGLARRYPRMRIVQLHCWPFLAEAGSLARHLPNVYIDTCWQPILNPEFFRYSLRTWLGYVPHHKILCSQDATSVEMAAGSSRIVRRILSEELRRAGSGLGIAPAELRRIAAGFLHGNAVAVYGPG